MKYPVVKNPIDTKRLMMAVAMTAFMVSQAFAATLNPDVVIEGDQITVGDIFEGAGTSAGHVLAPAPAMGKPMTLNARDLKRISDAFNLGWSPSGGAAQAVIRRTAKTVDRYDIEAALQEKLAMEFPGKTFDLELPQEAAAFFVPGKETPDIRVDSFSHDPSEGAFSAVVSAGGVRKDVQGRLHMIERVPVLKSALRQGDIISADDIEFMDMRARDISQNMIVDAKKLVGRTPRRGVAAMKPLSPGDLSLPQVVKKGDLVTMALNSNALSLTAQGRALENGAEGEVVSIMNTVSKQVIEAVVTGPQSVSVNVSQVSQGE